MRPILKGRGYHQIDLYKNRIVKQIGIHRLVAQAFIPNPNNKPQVNHKDGIKINNHVSNLEWVSASENIQHAILNNLRDTPKGENHYFSKLTNADVLCIKKYIQEGKSNMEIANILNICRSSIWQIRVEKAWKHVKL